VRHGPASLARLGALALAVTTLAGCGSTVATSPVPHNQLEELLVNPFPVYWLGGSFHALQISEATQDPSGGVSVAYGTCIEGGQGTCLAPLRIVTSADNGFLPGGSAAGASEQIRGAPAVLTQGGRTIVIPTGGVVVDIYARDRGLARAAALTVVPINQPAAPGAPFPPRRPDTGYGATSLPWQEPTPLRPLR
jgi:hypothetical protein